jgi:chromosomal replication initiation ATPase DnaA
MSSLDQTKIQDALERSEQKVCGAYGITKDIIHTRSRMREYSHSRFAVWFVLNAVENIPISRIAKLYGYDHTSVMYGVRVAKSIGIPAELGYELAKNGLTTCVQPVDKSCKTVNNEVEQHGDKKVIQL